MFRSRINHDDLKRLCTEFAAPALEVEPISTAIDKLIEMDSSRHWFSEWQLHISPTLKKISDLKSRKAQALQCRIDIIENLEKLKVSTFILNASAVCLLSAGITCFYEFLLFQYDYFQQFEQ